MLRCITVCLLLLLLTGCERDDDGPSGLVTLTGGGDRPPQPSQAPDFGRDVRPILSDHCFRCHGPDAASRKRDLRLDTPEGAAAALRGGGHAIVPGDLSRSEAIRRINAQDPDEIMPPPEMKHPLSAAQKQTLADWVTAGATYQPHWAFVPPQATTPPEARNPAWNHDDIDRFVIARLEREGLVPSPEADRTTLLRRVALALTGLPPTPQETDAFVANPSPDAYQKQVDRLLASARYGERMASDWLDVARFADTFGYQSDWECRVWPWRDWLIEAFNSNLPYDRFIRDQLAGDLVSEPGAPGTNPSGPTRAQRIATAMNRLHRQTNEGGSIDEEFRQEYISDRVHTFGSAFIGMTVECARCHDHKYDPIPQADYYSLGAFFGAIDEAGTYPYATSAVPRPAMRLPTLEQQAELTRLAAAQEAAESALAATRASRQQAAAAWLAGAGELRTAPPVRRYPLTGDVDSPAGKATALDGDSGPSFADVPGFTRRDPHSLVFWMKCPERKARATVIHTSRFTIESDEQGYQVMLKDGRLCWEVIHLWPGSAAAIRTAAPFPLDRWVQVAVTYDGSSRASGLRVWLDGVQAATEVVHDHLDGPATVRSFEVGFRDRDQGFSGGQIADLQVFDRELCDLEIADLHQPGSLQQVARSTPAGEIGAAMATYFCSAVDQECLAAAKSLHGARGAYQALLESIPELMVMEESPRPRQSFVLSRGQYDQQDLSRPVFPDRALSAVLPFDPAWPRNRMGLATWTTDPRNPLTARVAVNRLWAVCFGRGIVPSLENFGLQGDAPSHPEVLELLATEFVKSGWDVKAMVRRIVLSATFRQSSVMTPEGQLADPENKLLGRGPVVRLSAEALRDQALAASGLLAEQIGGPSVKPWQPPGVWEDAGVSSQGAYVPDTGVNAHRRSLYTYRKRTAPPPNMLAFDAGSREKCLARRQSTNTPLQPLVLMNDLVYVECARALAERVTRDAGPEPRARVALAFRLLTSREPRPGELGALLALYDQQVLAFEADAASAKAVLGVPEPDAPRAALVLVCSTVLACDAAVTSR